MGLFGARLKSQPETPQVDSEAQVCDTRHVLIEARVVLPGVQALLGFQLAGILTNTLEALPTSSQVLHLGPEVGQDHPAPRSRLEPRELEHAAAVECPAHRVSPDASGAARRSRSRRSGCSP